MMIFVIDTPERAKSILLAMADAWRVMSGAVVPSTDDGPADSGFFAPVFLIPDSVAVDKVPVTYFKCVNKNCSEPQAVFMPSQHVCEAGTPAPADWDFSCTTCGVRMMPAAEVALMISSVGGVVYMASEVCDAWRFAASAPPPSTWIYYGTADTPIVGLTAAEAAQRAGNSFFDPGLAMPWDGSKKK